MLWLLESSQGGALESLKCCEYLGTPPWGLVRGRPLRGGWHVTKMLLPKDKKGFIWRNGGGDRQGRASCIKKVSQGRVLEYQTVEKEFTSGQLESIILSLLRNHSGIK